MSEPMHTPRIPHPLTTRVQLPKPRTYEDRERTLPKKELQNASACAKIFLPRIESS